MYKYICGNCNLVFYTYPSKKAKFCSISCAARYRLIHCSNFGFKKGHKKRVGIRHPESFIESRKGCGNPGWKGEKAKKSSIHCWVRRNFVSDNVCELCGTKNALAYDWSNKDHKYSRDRKDWKKLCRSCHIKYDSKHNGWMGRYEKRKTKFVEAKS